MIRRPPRSTQSRSSAASDVYKRQVQADAVDDGAAVGLERAAVVVQVHAGGAGDEFVLSLIHISEPTRPY